MPKPKPRERPKGPRTSISGRIRRGRTDPQTGRRKLSLFTKLKQSITYQAGIEPKKQKKPSKKKV